MQKEQRSKLKEDLRTGVVRVVFKKADGTLRTMECTLAEYLLPDCDHGKCTHTSGETQIVYDLDKEAWRSFRFDRVIEVEAVG